MEHHTILNNLLQTSVTCMVDMICEVIWKCCDKKVPGLITLSKL